MTDQPTPEEFDWVRDARMCAVCHRVLDVRREVLGSGELGEDAYQHAGADLDADHEPDPVPVDGRVKIRCDFCAAEVPQWACWTVPTTPFHQMTLLGTPTGDWSHIADSDFAADEDCAQLVVDGRWAKLIVKARRAAEERLGYTLDPISAELLADHTLKVRDNMKGPPYLESELL